MSKRKKRIIGALLTVFIILNFPFLWFGINDGGSWGFGAILYEVVIWNPMEDGQKGVSIDLFRHFNIYFKR